MRQCFFKREVVKQKKKEGWIIATISKSNEEKNKRQGIVLMEIRS